MENKLAITSIILMIAGFTYFGINTQESDYYCLDRKITAHCEDFSKYYSLENGKCLNKVVGNKLCRSGWEEIPFEETIQPVVLSSVGGSSTTGRHHMRSKGCIDCN